MMLITPTLWLTQELGHSALVNQPIIFKDREALRAQSGTGGQEVEQASVILRTGSS